MLSYLVEQVRPTHEDGDVAVSAIVYWPNYNIYRHCILNGLGFGLVYHVLDLESEVLDLGIDLGLCVIDLVAVI